jgi:ERCC4-type nuclease
VSIVACLIDSREPSWVQALTFGAQMTSITALDAGDLLATTDDGALIAVERKTASDLLGSINDGRIWTQLAGLRAQTPWAYLVITGHLACSTDGKVTLDHGITGWTWAALQGALVQAQELGVMVVQASGDADYEPTVMRLSARSHTSELVIKPVKMPSILSDSERILTALPGIGLERVKDIVTHAGRPCWALQWLTDLHCEGHVPGIGPQIKRKVREALGLKPEEELSVIITETGMIADKE